MKLKNFKEVSLVLSGGAAKGIAHIGVLKALEELNIKVKRLSGTSAGAIVSVFYAYGYSPQDMLEIIENLNWFKLFKLKTPRIGLIGWEKAQEFLKDYISIEKLEDLNKPVSLCAVDLYTGKPLYFSTGELTPILFGSCAIPGIFEPVQYKSYLLIDGGVMNNLPVEPCEMYDEPIICVDVLPITQEKRIKNIFDVLVRSFFLAVRSNSEKRKRYCDIVITPDLSNYSPLDVKKAKDIFLRGYKDTLRVLKDIF